MSKKIIIRGVTSLLFTATSLTVSAGAPFEAINNSNATTQEPTEYICQPEPGGECQIFHVDL